MKYKVIYNNRIIDILDTLMYVRFQQKHGVLLLCDEDNAEGILSSDGSTAYHTCELKQFPVDDYLTVSIEEITSQEYNTLKKRHCLSYEEIIDDYTATLFSQGVI